MAKTKKPSEEAVGVYETISADLPGAEHRKVFGSPCVFLNGNMFAGIHGLGIIMRLAENDRAEFLGIDGAVLFEPMPGRPMKEYVVVPPAMLGETKKLRKWMERSLAYAESLPAKEKKEKGAGKKAAATKPAAKKAAATKGKK